MRPAPWQVAHGSGTTLPVPWQVGHVCWIEKKPCDTRTSPRPLHVGHCFGVGARLGAGAVAGLALVHRRNADLDLGAARRVLQRQLEVVAQVGAAIHAVAAAAAAALLPEDLAEDVAERIGESAEAFRPRAARRIAAERRIHAGMSELVVRRALAGVRQNFVRLLRFLEFRFGALVVRIAIRMVLHRELAIGLLELVVGRVALDAEHRVVVAFRHGSILGCNS